MQKYCAFRSPLQALNPELRPSPFGIPFCRLALLVSKKRLAFLSGVRLNDAMKAGLKNEGPRCCEQDEDQDCNCFGLTTRIKNYEGVFDGQEMR